MCGFPWRVFQALHNMAKRQKCRPEVQFYLGLLLLRAKDFSKVIPFTSVASSPTLRPADARGIALSPGDVKIMSSSVPLSPPGAASCADCLQIPSKEHGISHLVHPTVSRSTISLPVYSIEAPAVSVRREQETLLHFCRLPFLRFLYLHPSPLPQPLAVPSLLQAAASFQAAIDIMAARPEDSLSRSRRALLAVAKSHFAEVCLPFPAPTHSPTPAPRWRPFP